MGHQTRPAPRPPRPNRTGQTDDTASAGESPAAKNTLRARRAADLASCQPGLDADQISLYRHHQCLRALQRGTLRARQDFGGVPRTHQFLITLMVHTTKLKPAGHATDHIGKINDEWPPRDSHPERRSTIPAASQAHVRDLYALAPTLPAAQSHRLLIVLDLCYGAGARASDFKTLKGNSITEASWGDEPVAVVRLPNRAGGTRLVPVADPEISDRLLRQARATPSSYLLSTGNGDTVERNAANRVGEHLRAHGHRSINVAALRNRWLLNIAATVPAALMLQLADVTTAQILADQRDLLPTYDLRHAIALTKETYL